MALSPVRRPTLRGADPCCEVAVLLVGQRLDRGRVERPPALAQRPIDRVLGHDGLAAARGRADDHRTSGVEVFDRFDLESVESEGALRRAGHAPAAALPARRMRIRPKRIAIS